MSRTTLLTGTLAFAIAAGAAQFGCDRGQPAAAPPPATGPASSADAPVKLVTLPVEGMSCAACVASVRKTLNSVEGVTGVEVSLEHRQAKVHYREKQVTPERVAEAVKKLGYKTGEPMVEGHR